MNTPLVIWICIVAMVVTILTVRMLRRLAVAFRKHQIITVVPDSNPARIDSNH